MKTKPSINLDTMTKTKTQQELVNDYLKAEQEYIVCDKLDLEMQSINAKIRVCDIAEQFTEEGRILLKLMRA